MGTAHRALNTLTSSSRPISITEFVNTLSKIWKPSKSYGGNKAETFGKYFISEVKKVPFFRAEIVISGLAISGGVDSMALAALCSQVHSSFSNITQSQSLEKRGGSLLESLREVGFRAFVVDHGVRRGSATEAQAVAKVLEERGIEVIHHPWRLRN
jgi:asparagine synthetase B (glutamine-hydrolysing)